KSTFVSIYGIDKAKSMLDNLTEDAIGSLKYFGEKAGFLTRLANYLLIREN
ncbi:MAG: polyprenyl synthetase family protein, partial [Clostridiaceae bacterium]|nr:polyprenyl synthetase family protein [Clostridiaceae bacterium]